mmetsp:Transcript_7727/g.28976  ORF Transcript_7727/g.28976 Transcript_7727/m.28976 type:complete len:543 (-) Transcript_7727:82-1710(-)
MDKIPLKKRYLHQYISPTKDALLESGAKIVCSPPVENGKNAAELSSLASPVDAHVGKKSPLCTKIKSETKPKRTSRPCYDEDETFVPSAGEVDNEESMEIEDELEMMEQGGIIGVGEVEHVKKELLKQKQEEVVEQELSDDDVDISIYTEAVEMLEEEDDEEPEEDETEYVEEIESPKPRTLSTRRTRVSRRKNSQQQQQPQSTQSTKNGDSPTPVPSTTTMVPSPKSPPSKTTSPKPNGIPESESVVNGSTDADESDSNKKVNGVKRKLASPPPSNNKRRRISRKKTVRVVESESESESEESSSDEEEEEKKQSLSATFRNIVQNNASLYAPRQTRNQIRHEKILLGEIKPESPLSAKSHTNGQQSTQGETEVSILEDSDDEDVIIDEESAPEIITPRRRRRISLIDEKDSSTFAYASDTASMASPRLTSSSRKIQRKKTPRKIRRTPRIRRKVANPTKEEEEKPLKEDNREEETRVRLQENGTSETPADEKADSKEDDDDDSGDEEDDDDQVSQSRLFRQIAENPWALQTMPRRRSKTQP